MNVMRTLEEIILVFFGLIFLPKSTFWILTRFVEGADSWIHITCFDMVHRSSTNKIMNEKGYSSVNNFTTVDSESFRTAWNRDVALIRC